MMKLFFQQVFYCDNSSNEPHLITIPGFADFAPLDEFRIQKHDYIQLYDLYSEYDIFSGNTYISISFSDPSLSTKFSSSFICVFLIVCILLQL